MNFNKNPYVEKVASEGKQLSPADIRTMDIIAQAHNDAVVELGVGDPLIFIDKQASFSEPEVNMYNLEREKMSKYLSEEVNKSASAQPDDTVNQIKDAFIALNIEAVFPECLQKAANEWESSIRV